MSELAEPGAFFTADVESTAVLVVRDTQGTIRAFVNLCRHRGARLVHEKQGVTKQFTCILHGWIYDAEGNMGGAPLARMAKDNPMLAALRTTNALIPLPSEIRHGFVWVVPQPRAAIDVAAALGVVDAELAARGAEDYAVSERTETPLPPEAPAEVVRFSYGEDTIALDLVHRRRAESDFGESTSHGEEQLSLERLVLAKTKAR